jgi:hypothetical protein
LHVVDAWHPDRIEIEAAYAIKMAPVERLNCGGLSGTRGAGDDEDIDG